jgi:ribosomal-protein-alanine N-acetyltransferase
MYFQFMRVRLYQPSDLEALYQLDQSCFPPGVSYSRDEIAQFVAHRRARTWVAEADGQLVGFLIAFRQPSKAGHIVTLDVAEAWRRRAVGTALMDAAEAWVRGGGAELIYLETAEDNLAAQAFYRKRGYQKVKKIEEYYANGAAAWVMAKRL